MTRCDACDACSTYPRPARACTVYIHQCVTCVTTCALLASCAYVKARPDSIELIVATCSRAFIPLASLMF